MPLPGFALFDTAIGRCGIAWSERGVVCGVHLPESSPSATRKRLALRFSGWTEQTPPAQVQRAIDRIVTLLRGEAADLSEIELDMALLPEFQRRVYEQCRRIPRGATLSYG